MLCMQCIFCLLFFYLPLFRFANRARKSHLYGIDYDKNNLNFIAMILTAIIEDDREIRAAIRHYLSTQPTMVCEIGEDSIEAFLSVLNDDTAPDVILMDIGLPGISGISGIKLIKERYPEIDIIMFTIYEDPHKIFQSLCAGASAYLLKNSQFEEIKRTIEIVHAGGSRMSPEIARKVIEHFHIDKKPQPSSVLSPKEKEVVTGLVDGLSYKMIAGSQDISIETVRSHIKNIYKKLHVHTKADVIRKSLRGEI